MTWIQKSMMICGDLELTVGTETPLLMVTPKEDVLVSNLTGTILTRISSRPFFVPLTQQEAFQVMGALAMEDASALLASLDLAPPASTNTEPTDSPKESET